MHQECLSLHCLPYCTVKSPGGICPQIPHQSSCLWYISDPYWPIMSPNCNAQCHKHSYLNWWKPLRVTWLIRDPRPCTLKHTVTVNDRPINCLRVASVKNESQRWGTAHKWCHLNNRIESLPLTKTNSMFPTTPTPLSFPPFINSWSRATPSHHAACHSLHTQPQSEKGGGRAGCEPLPRLFARCRCCACFMFLNGSRMERITAAGCAPCAPSSSLLFALTLALHLRLIFLQSCVLDVVNVVQRLNYKSLQNDPPVRSRVLIEMYAHTVTRA